MIAPIVPYTIRGAIWYQGESNASQARLYRKLFPTMILSWRRAWGDEFPFLFVQLANYNARKRPPTGQPEDSQWAELREAQAMTLELPRTGMAVAIDIGEAERHSPEEQTGSRAPPRARRGSDGVLPRPGILRPALRRRAGRGRQGAAQLPPRRRAEGADGGKLKGFAIAGADKKFVWADAEIEGDHIVVSSPEVAEPVAVALRVGGQSRVQSRQRHRPPRLALPHRRLAAALTDAAVRQHARSARRRKRHGRTPPRRAWSSRRTRRRRSSPPRVRRSRKPAAT